MFEYIKLKQEIHELKARNNTLEIENELLRDRRLDELIKSLDKQNKYEEQAEQIKKLETKIQALKEIIRDGSYVKNKR